MYTVGLFFMLRFLKANFLFHLIFSGWFTMYDISYLARHIKWEEKIFLCGKPSSWTSLHDTSVQIPQSVLGRWRATLITQGLGLRALCLQSPHNCSTQSSRGAAQQPEGSLTQVQREILWSWGKIISGLHFLELSLIPAHERNYIRASEGTGGQRPGLGAYWARWWPEYLEAERAREPGQITLEELDKGEKGRPALPSDPRGVLRARNRRQGEKVKNQWIIAVVELETGERQEWIQRIQGWVLQALSYHMPPTRSVRQSHWFKRPAFWEETFKPTHKGPSVRYTAQIMFQRRQKSGTLTQKLSYLSLYI